MLFDFFRKRREPISWFGGTDPEMLEAISQAQRTFPEFVAALEQETLRALPALDAALVKYAVPATKQGVKVEHIFLSSIETQSGHLRGVVSSSPQYTSDVAEGDLLEIDPARVSDWMYVINGVGTGGYTFRVMWKRFSPTDRAAFGPQPPYVWLRP